MIYGCRKGEGATVCPEPVEGPGAPRADGSAIRPYLEMDFLQIVWSCSIICSGSGLCMMARTAQ